MRESSKLRYTCACNEYTWAMKYKHIGINCCSLLVQVYIQVLMKSSSKQVFTIWSTTSKHAKNIIYVKACKLNESLEIVIKPYALFSKSPKHGGLPTKLPWRWCNNLVYPSCSCIYHQGTITLTSCESPHLHQTRGGDFGTHFLLGLRGLVLFGTQKFL